MRTVYISIGLGHHITTHLLTQEENVKSVLNTRLMQETQWDFILHFYQDFVKDQSPHIEDVSSLMMKVLTSASKSKTI